MTDNPILDDMWAILAPVDIKEFEVVAGAASAEAVAAYEAKLGFKLPDDFRELCQSKLGGIYVGARTEVWPEAKLYDVGPAWTFWRGLLVFGLAPDIPDWLSMNVMLDQVREQEQMEFAPFLKVEGDPHIWGFRPDHSIAIFDGYELEPDSAGHFRELYSREIDALLDRINDMKDLQAERASKKQQ